MPTGNSNDRKIAGGGPVGGDVPNYPQTTHFLLVEHPDDASDTMGAAQPISMMRTRGEDVVGRFRTPY